MARYKPGESGNRSGKKPGTINKRTQLAKLLEPHAEALVNKTVELALNGDSNALRLCIDRLIPKAKDGAIITMPNSRGMSMENVIREIFHSLSGQNIAITELGRLMSFTGPDLIQANKTEASLAEVAEMMKKYQRDY